LTNQEAGLAGLGKENILITNNGFRVANKCIWLYEEGNKIASSTTYYIANGY
jgi:hypothetical protein